MLSRQSYKLNPGLKIVFVAPSAYLLGGVQDWLYMLTLGLRERGHHVTVAVPNNKFHRLDRFNAHFEGIRAIPFFNRTGTPEGRIRGLCSCIIVNQADIIVGVNIGDIYEAFWRVKGRLKRSRLVMTVHAIEANYFSDIKDYSGVIDAVVTTNRLTELMVSKLAIVSSSRIFYAPYGIHRVEGLREIDSKACLKLAWVGRIENAQKRVYDVRSILVELDKLGVKYRLSIAGEGEIMDDLKRDLEFWIKKGKVEFYGFLKKEDMHLFYCKHNVLLITSKWETGPIVAWEAMSCGLAVVSSRYVGSKAEKALIHNETALLYPLGGAKEAALQIKRLTNPLVYRQIASNGRRMVNSRYSAEVSLTAWEGAFQRIRDLPDREGLPMTIKRRTQANGRLELLLGSYLSEKVRLFLPPSVSATNPGSEWPHSLQGKSDQTSILNFAEEVEKTSTDTRCTDI